MIKVNAASPVNPPSLHISIEDSVGKLTFTLRIRFFNPLPEDLQFSFSNRARKAEFLGLEVVDVTLGQRVEPQRGLVIRPIRKAIEPIVLRSGESWSYDLVAKLESDELNFPGARYSLEDGHLYEMKFRYGGVASNAVKFKYAGNAIRAQ